MRGIRGRRCKQLLDGLLETRGFWKLKEEALDRTVWRNRFGGDFGRFVRQTTNDSDGICGQDMIQGIRRSAVG